MAWKPLKRCRNLFTTRWPLWYTRTAFYLTTLLGFFFFYVNFARNSALRVPYLIRPSGLADFGRHGDSGPDTVVVWGVGEEDGSNSERRCSSMDGIVPCLGSMDEHAWQKGKKKQLKKHGAWHRIGSRTHGCGSLAGWLAMRQQPPRKRN